MVLKLTGLADLPRLGFDTVIDVRSPAEYAEDHLPGAINLPVLDDEQRVRVGTLYKQTSAFEAKKLGAALVAFNRDWSRRVLGQGAVVLLITDGLDRDDAAGVAAEMERLHLSARRLIWLNPLLRWDGFAPRAAGVAAMLPHVDSLRAGHSVASLEALGRVISQTDDVGEKARLMQMLGTDKR